ncbi:MAG: DUF6600 domain-containing protein [Aestuariivirga sp.]
MTIKKLALGTAAASGILFALATMSPIAIVSAAQAQTSVSVNFGIGGFYDRLSPYGNWVSYQDQYVFLPDHVDRGWRPYTLGHWAFTDRYGWMWVSNERFGWATYHYGRWGYSQDIGWYWVPGRRWAPAWVAWSRGDSDVAWAPLPPRRGGEDVSVNITIGDVPDYYWQAVPTSAFLSINLSDRIIRDRNHVRTIVQQRPPETVRIENNIVVNNVIQVNEIERATKTKVKVLTEKPVTSPDAAGKTDANSVGIFNPEVKDDATAKPQKPVKVEDVISRRKAKGIQTDIGADAQPVVPGQTPVQATTPAPGTPPAVATQPADKTKPADKVQMPAGGKQQKDVSILNQDNTVAPLQPADGSMKKNRKQMKDVPAGQPPILDAPGAKPPREKFKGNAPVDGNNANKIAPLDNTNPPVDQLRRNKPRNMPGDLQKMTPPVPGAQKPMDQKMNGQMQNNNGQKPGNKNKVPCDPNKETCPPAQ